MPKALIETYGCTLNQADSRIMGSLLEKAGYQVEYGEFEPQKSNYDIIILNTCTVKTPTEQKILHKIGSIKNLGKRLIIAGCLASASPEKIEEIAPEASLISTENIDAIAEVAEKAKAGNKSIVEGKRRIDKMQLFSPYAGIIAKIPISEGCLGNCTFCETKFARGPLNSFSEELIISAIKRSITMGAKEIELTAQDTGAYGVDRKTNIVELLEKAVQIEGNFKIRLGMLNPEHLSKYLDGLVEIYKSEKMYKFIHIPVQSGSNKVLKGMKREYTIEEFEAYAKELRKKVEGIAIETDVIVGYPTETFADYEETEAMLKEVRPEVTNVSKFGARPHAEASLLPQLNEEEIKARSIRMSRLVRSIQYEARKALVGTVQTVLFTEENERSINGRTSNYLAVYVEKDSKKSIMGKAEKARITGNTSATLIGELDE